MASRSYLLRIYHSNRYVYAQVIRKPDGHIVCCASTIEKSVREGLASSADRVAATRVGEVLASRAGALGIAAVHWLQKPGQRYLGKTVDVLEAVKSGGLRLV